MKLAISVPDETFRRVALRAAELGISPDEFYARAAVRYLDDLEDYDASAVTSYSRRWLADDDNW